MVVDVALGKMKKLQIDFLLNERLFCQDEEIFVVEKCKKCMLVNYCKSNYPLSCCSWKDEKIRIIIFLNI